MFLRESVFKSLGEAKDKCRGFVLGTAIGDAMGVPFESKNERLFENIIKAETGLD